MPDYEDNNQTTESPKRLRLGVPLDLFFDRDENRLSEIERAVRENSAYPLPGGIMLPDDINAGTGNIVIRGRPGSGKSILAMQLAQKCCEMNDENYFSWFIALEETPEHVAQKSKNFDWDKWFYCIRHLNHLQGPVNPQRYGEILEQLLTKCVSSPNQYSTPGGNHTCNWPNMKLSNCPIHDGEADPDNKKYPHCHKNKKPRVCISRFSPRHLSPTDGIKQDIFEERYDQLESLLKGATWLKENRADFPRLAMVCIDSLNVFGDRLLTREQLYRLFDLFKRNQVIGIFVLEEDERQVLSPDSRLHGDEIEFLADVIIALKYDEDGGYFIRYFEIVKSHYQHQVYGKHPFKIIKKDEKKHKKKDQDKDQLNSQEIDINMPVETGIVIFPSLHYIVYGTVIVETKNE